MAAFWASKGYSVEEAVALLGAHTLSDEQQCFRWVLAHGVVWG